MYQLGAYVNYGGHGICQITELRAMNFGNGEGNYYVLSPINQSGAVFYLPVDNEKALKRLRPVLTREEIDAILSSAGQEQMPWIADRKQRAASFQQILTRRDTRELLLLAGCLHRQMISKGLSFSDKEILSKIENAIEQEFAFVLHIQREDIGQYIQARL